MHGATIKIKKNTEKCVAAVTIRKWMMGRKREHDDDGDEMRVALVIEVIAMTIMMMKSEERSHSIISQNGRLRYLRRVFIYKCRFC